MEFIPIDEANRERVTAFLCSRWLTTQMVIRGQVFDMTQAHGIVALENDKIKGLVTYDIRERICEILSLDSLAEGSGIGTELVRRVISTAQARGCRKVTVVTTNDNLNALRFYQKAGFRHGGPLPKRAGRIPQAKAGDPPHRGERHPAAA